MSKFVELIKTKPFIFIIALAVVAIVAASAIFIFPNAESKNPAADIQCICEIEEFRSGKDGSGDYQQYSMIFQAPQGLKSPIVDFSYNVEQVMLQRSTSVELSFALTQGTNFWISISSQNYQTKKFHFTATPYIRTLDMNFDLVDSSNYHYTLSSEGLYNLLYLTESENYASAIRDRLPSQVEFSVSSNAQTIEDRYNIEVSNDSVLKLENNTITPKSLGNCTITLSATDGSEFVKKIKFKVCKVPVLNISNLPDEVCINVQESLSYQLKNFNVHPTYADLSFFDYEDNIIKCKDMVITAKALGNTELVFANQNNVIQHRMQISVVNQTPSPDDDNNDDNGQNNNQTSEFTIKLADNSNENINYNDNTKTFTLSLADFSNNRGILKILISVEGTQGTTNFDADYEVEDENGIILEHKILLGNVGISFIFNAPGTVILTIQNTELGIPPLEIFIVVNA